MDQEHPISLDESSSDDRVNISQPNSLDESNNSNDSVNISLSGETRKRKKKPTIKERKEDGHRVCNQTQLRTYIVVAYAQRFHEPDESEWPQIMTTLVQETGMGGRSIREVFTKCLSGDPNPELQQSGAGRPRKLDKINPGVVAASLALNTGASPKVATGARTIKCVYPMVVSSSSSRN
jgi:hypothetical protein